MRIGDKQVREVSKADLRVISQLITLFLVKTDRKLALSTVDGNEVDRGRAGRALRI